MNPTTSHFQNLSYSNMFFGAVFTISLLLDQVHPLQFPSKHKFISHVNLFQSSSLHDFVNKEIQKSSCPYIEPHFCDTIELDLNDKVQLDTDLLKLKGRQNYLDLMRTWDGTMTTELIQSKANLIAIEWPSPLKCSIDWNVSFVSDYTSTCSPIRFLTYVSPALNKNRSPIMLIQYMYWAPCFPGSKSVIMTSWIVKVIAVNFHGEHYRSSLKEYFLKVKHGFHMQ